MNTSFQKVILDPLLKSINLYSDRNAFFINDKYYSYKEFGKSIFKIRESLQNLDNKENLIGLVLNDDLETYSSIFSLWIEGKAYIPLHPSQPIERNEKILSQVKINTVLDSSNNSNVFSNCNTINTTKLDFIKSDLNKTPYIDDDSYAYILFTSGSTGEPKGVPITRNNLASFINSFWDLGFIITEKDRCLQMFELTFDLSVMSYLIPLLKGACVYTVPKEKIKYSYIYELMEDYKLTFSLMVPSILNYLRPYFYEMNFPNMRYSLFCGEALSLDITSEWSKILPNAQIFNVYGPTENTIFCTSYQFNKNYKNKSYNGILSVGKQMLNNEIIVIDEENNILPPNEKGELCLSGDLLTPGYWKNNKKNKEAFFLKLYNGVKTRFYKTGDICVIDNEKDILYVGRSDSQVKIQGFRIEISEIEYHARSFFDKKNLVILPFSNKLKNNEIALIIEGVPFPKKEVIDYLKSKLPFYMIPTRVEFVEEFPLNTSGKTDKKMLKIKLNL